MQATLLELRDRTIREAINVANPSSILTAIAAALDRLSKWIGRSQAEAAKAQQPEIDRMDAEIQGMHGTHDTEPQATAPAALPVAVDGRG